MVHSYFNQKDLAMKGKKSDHKMKKMKEKKEHELKEKHKKKHKEKHAKY